ncbi:SpoIIAA family protein [Mycobacterium antarcticum]|uniref:STAS/SEC14 domain-containing protein n=1 Tax=unclassified Mycolicibacterium TaxID=2636767 RepID=UPI0024E0B940|nr:MULTISPECIES: STAS/SEC14 domain-containing protein [unclassified Mycolicibacterium]
MIDVDLDTEHAILHIRPESSLEEGDFTRLATIVDPFIETVGGLSGLIIDAPKFPGWESFGAMVTHIRFVRDHHKDVKKIAVVTDSHLGDVAEYLAIHFISAEIRHFPAGDVEAARQWITAG